METNERTGDRLCRRMEAESRNQFDEFRINFSDSLQWLPLASTIVETLKTPATVEKEKSS